MLLKLLAEKGGSYYRKHCIPFLWDEEGDARGPEGLPRGSCCFPPPPAWLHTNPLLPEAHDQRWSLSYTSCLQCSFLAKWP